MSAQSLVGQSLSSRASRISVFGGMDDRFVLVDSLTGRVVDVATSGRTVLFPWSADKFISIRGLLGRESLVTIELREYADAAPVLPQTSLYSKRRASGSRPERLIDRPDGPPLRSPS